MRDLYFRLTTGDVANNCFKAIHDMVAKYHGKYFVTVKIGIDDNNARSLAQNRLYWLWLTALANQLGESKDYYHLYCKRHFLSKIYLRDSVDIELANVQPSLKIAKQCLPKHDYESIAWGVAKGVSTTLANSQQMKEYLNDVYNFGFDKGVDFPMPDDLMWSVR